MSPVLDFGFSVVIQGSGFMAFVLKALALPAYVYVYVCMYVYVYKYMYIHTYLLTYLPTYMRFPFSIFGRP